MKDYAKDTVICQNNLRVFTQAGTIAGAERFLPDIAATGANSFISIPLQNPMMSRIRNGVHDRRFPIVRIPVILTDRQRVRNSGRFQIVRGSSSKNGSTEPGTRKRNSSLNPITSFFKGRKVTKRIHLNKNMFNNLTITI